MAFKVFLDTNIFLDHFLDRDPFSTKVLEACENEMLTGFASSASFYTIAYLIRKSSTTAATKRIIHDYLRFISILPTEKSSLRHSLETNFTDLEDAFQYATALQEESLDFFLTNNLKDFKHASNHLPVLTPKKFVSEYLKS